MLRIREIVDFNMLASCLQTKLRTTGDTKAAEPGHDPAAGNAIGILRA